MTRKAVGDLWRALSIAAVYLTWNTLSATHGMHVEMPGIDFDGRHQHVAALYGAIAIAVLLLLAQWLWGHYMALAPAGRRWQERMPPVLGAGMRPNTLLGRRMQALGLLVLVVFPVIGQADLFARIVAGTTYETAGNTRVKLAQGVSHFTEFRTPGSDRYRYGSPDEGEAGGVSFWPGVEPWLLLVLQGAAVAATLWRMYSALRGTRHR